MIDDVINKANAKEGYDKEAYIQKKKEQLDKVYGLIDESLGQIKEDTNFLKQYIDVQSRFDMYSPKNALLITKQLPNATKIKEYKKWKEANVNFKDKYPKRILILDPKEPYQTKNGRTVRGYNAKEMIDISETNMKPTSKTYDKKLVLQALLHECPIEIKAVDSLDSGKMCEWNSEMGAIYVCRNEDYDSVIKAVATEIAKINVYENTKEIDDDKANGVGYMVCSKYGIETNFESLKNLSTKYSTMESEEIVNDLTCMKEVLRDINNRMGQYLDEKTKEAKNVDRNQER